MKSEAAFLILANGFGDGDHGSGGKSMSIFSRRSARTRKSSPPSSAITTVWRFAPRQKVTANILAKAARLRVIGRAGIGRRQCRHPAATARASRDEHAFRQFGHDGEHAIALMFALARGHPAADGLDAGGQWEKKPLSWRGDHRPRPSASSACGNIGAIVATRALGLKMRVVAFDPFLSRGAMTLGVDK